MPPVERTRLDPDVVGEVLSRGELSITGRLTDASNVTLLGRVSADGIEFDCVYKPIRGERPLWDFPDGTLAEREVAAYQLSRHAGWDCVPYTVFRDGPVGAGMAQQWIVEPEEAGDLVDVVPVDQIPAGWLPVLRAVDGDGAEVAVVHADDPALAVLAGFDLVVNNADRKGSHVLTDGPGRVLGVDHGLTFHAQDKLRTILWGWAGQPLPDRTVEGLEKLSSGLSGALGEQLSELLTVTEVRRLGDRITALRDRPEFPHAPTDRYPIPWPPL